MIRKVFTEDLPKGGTCIKWKESIGLRVRFIYDNIEGEIEILSYDGIYLSVKYLDEEPFKISRDGFKDCKLGNLLDVYSGKFKIEIGTTFKDDKRDITIIDRKLMKDLHGCNRKYYKYKCNKCGFECGIHYKNGEHKDDYWIIEGHLLGGGKGCACCCNSPTVICPEINSIVARKDTEWMIPYFQGGYGEAKKYNPRCNKKIYLVCPDCGRIKDKAMQINTLFSWHSIGCICGDAIKYPEKLMTNILTQLLNKDFEYQFNPDWIKPSRYDFYFKLNNEEYIIETDGKLGHGKRIHSKSEITAEQSIMIDDYKNDMADRHGIEMIRIDCEKSELEYIKNNIEDSILNKLFDLDKIDWVKAEEFALSNLCKKACEYKKDNPDLTTTQIGEIMGGLCNVTICNYLKRGTILGWCNYDAREEQRRCSIKAWKSCEKQIEMFKDDESLGKFPSATYLEKNGEELFGVKFTQNSISGVCRGINKTHRGYTFKYVA